MHDLCAMWRRAETHTQVAAALHSAPLIFFENVCWSTVSEWQEMPENIPDNTSTTYKLNILRLPSHTSILFALIALVVLGAALASLLPGSRFWWPPIVLGMTLLPLRDFLRRPDRIISRWRMAHRHDEDTAVIEGEMASLGADRPPTVVSTDRPLGAQAFGSFRRAYLGLGRSLAQDLASGLRAPPGRHRDRFRAILAHELAHFLNRDVWLMWLSYGLLKMMMLVMTLGLWVGISLSVFVIENGPEVLQPEFWTALSQHIPPDVPDFDLLPIYNALYQQNPSLVKRLADPDQRQENWEPFFLRLTAAYWPFAASGLVLFLIYWRRLLRVRELYADARAASLMGEADIVLEARLLYSTLGALTSTVLSQWERVRRWLLSLPKRIPIVNGQLALHPGRQERIDCLEDPLRAFGSWRWIAVSVGLAVVLLDFLLRGALTAFYIYEPGPHMPILVAFLVFAVWLLPRICVGSSLGQGLARQILLIVSLFTLIKLLSHLADAVVGLLMLKGDQEAWGMMLDLWIYSMVGGLGTEPPRLVGVEFSWLQIVEWHMVRPIAYFALLMPPTLIAFLLADACLKRRVLTWYRLGERVRRVFWGVSGLLGLVLVLVVIPIYNRLLFPYIYESWSVAMLAGMMIAFTIVPIGGALFWHYDQKLAERCPHCNTPVPDAYYLGKKCESCDRLLHPWLIANY